MRTTGDLRCDLGCYDFNVKFNLVLNSMLYQNSLSLQSTFIKPIFVGHLSREGLGIIRKVEGCLKRVQGSLMKDEEPEEVQKTSGRAGGDLESWDGLKD